MTQLDLRRRNLLVATGALGASAFAPSAAAQAAKWPTKPIRIVVAFPPGGLTDAYARQYGEFLSSRVGQPVTVENKPGAGAQIGIDFVAKSPPDGHVSSRRNQAISESAYSGHPGVTAGQRSRHIPASPESA